MGASLSRHPPIGLAGAAAKLRLLTDKDLGLSAEISEGEDTSLKQVGEFVEREAGATANPDEVAAPALTDDVIEETFEVVTSMGNDLMDASVLADGVTILAADSIEDQQHGAVLMRLARGIADHCKAVEERRGELFRLLHPNREHFEKEGVAGGGAAMSAAKLFRNWLALREAEHCRGQDDEEVERLTDKMIAIERAILAADPATAEDEQAQVAILAYYAVHEAPYANYEVLDRCYQRLVIDRLSDPIVREREREWGRKRVERAREKLSETD